MVLRNNSQGRLLSQRAVLLSPVLYLISAILLTWPFVTRFASALPLGSESTATVPQLNVWTLR
jgi:hypothetical protein